ncbi:MAG: Rrf2 family transcriptional regulator [Deltaproteobacteria bacterium]|nr:Rrf2 family transcriptional regulator [Deltaproteobacteria bacterium]
MFLKLSDATNLGFHSLVYLAVNYDEKRPVSTLEIAEQFNISANHLSKVLQRLAKARIVKSIRGPKGGFILAKDPADVSLKSIYEAIDGEIITGDICLLDKKRCNLSMCLLGNLIGDIENMVVKRFEETTIADAIKLSC